MKTGRLPPGQREIKALLRWNEDHPGIIPKNPRVDLREWTLTVDGEVEDPQVYDWDGLLRLPAVESRSDFHCVEGWSVKDCAWYGVRFNTLVQAVRPKKDARHVLFECLDGYTTSLDQEDLLQDDVLLAYKLNGQPLEASLGGPLRLVVPAKYAYKSAMWVKRVSFMKTKELGFWERRGYSDTANVWSNDRYTA